jgi:hypothetical protein
VPLVVVPVAVPPGLVVVVVVLLLLPHAASPKASVTVAAATRPMGLILLVTLSPFHRTEWATISPVQDDGGVA